METAPLRCVAYYVDNFLENTLTFIYRQLIGVSEQMETCVLTSRRINFDLFPFANVFESRQSKLQRATLKLKRAITDRYSNVSRSQFASWQKALVDNRVGLVHAQFGTGGLRMLPLANALDIPLIVTFRGKDATRSPRKTDYRRGLQVLFRSAKLLTVSRSLAERLIALGAPEDAVEVHYNGIPVDQFPFVERVPVVEKIRGQREIVFLQVSSFVEKKGHEHTVRVFKRVLDEYPRCRLVFAGDGKLRKRIERMCVDLGIDDKTTFLGAVPGRAVFPLMREADVFLQHSVTAADGDQEGVPNVVLEAMSTGLPVVSTIHSGIPEVIRDRVEGFLVGERDESAYEQKILELFNGNEDTGRPARARVLSEFNLNVQNEKLIARYRQLLR